MSLEKEELRALDLDADPSSRKKIVFVDRVLLQKVFVQGCFFFFCKSSYQYCCILIRKIIFRHMPTPAAVGKK